MTLFSDIVDLAQIRTRKICDTRIVEKVRFTMPPVNEFFLLLVVGAFAVFGVALAYASIVASGSR